jgi:BirA family transcriptional regulator, biotin operon repressor / biotin---[acetyl-CoA-carboxylase] ligase
VGFAPLPAVVARLMAHSFLPPPSIPIAPAKPALGVPIIRLAAIDSTQRYAADLAARGAADGTVVVADTQTAGKGRRGRVWHDVPGACLLVSVVVRSSLPVPRLPMLSLAAGVAVVDALEDVGVRARLKWPNDALVGGRKIAGILLERHGHAVVLGVGINVSPGAIPPDVAARATSVAGERGTADREVLLTALLAALTRWRTVLERDGFEPVRMGWTERAAGLGQRITVDGIEGTALGLDDDGALLVATPGGTRRVVAGDVALG